MRTDRSSERQLTDDERGVLLRIPAESPDPDGAVLRRQVAAAVVVEAIPAWTTLRVDRTGPPAGPVPRPIDADAVVVDADGEPVGGILLWLDDGSLSDIEYHWFADEMPTAFPSADRLRVRYPVNRSAADDAEP